MHVVHISDHAEKISIHKKLKNDLNKNYKRMLFLWNSGRGSIHAQYREINENKRGLFYNEVSSYGHKAFPSFLHRSMCNDVCIKFAV